MFIENDMTKMESLGLLAGGVAHDFNNILQPIIGYTELLLENFESGTEEHSYLVLIAHSARRARDLAAQIIAFSHNDPVAETAHNVTPVVREAIKLIRATLPASIALDLNVPDELLAVDCASSQIHQVLMNLCANAGQAIHHTGVVEISVGGVDLDDFVCFDGAKIKGRHVRLAVSDNGVGMDIDTLAHIFEPLFTTKGARNGTGLGLSTVFAIVEKNNGGVQVSSELGVGSTFEVFLPLSDKKLEISSDIAKPDQNTGAENILFVDDENAIAVLGKEILGRQGYNVAVALNAEIALELFAACPEHFDLVLTDQSMPNMTGTTLIRELQKIRPSLPIILCSGRSDTDLSIDSSSNGIVKFLAKPVMPDVMRRVVRETLDDVQAVGSKD